MVLSGDEGGPLSALYFLILMHQVKHISVLLKVMNYCPDEVFIEFNSFLLG